MKKKWIWAIVFLYIGFIFLNSLQIGETSGSLSSEITIYILNILQHLGIHLSFDTFHHFIRKCAHFSEYFLLGILVAESIHTAPILKNKKLNFFIFWILPPSIDESIQHFVPGRYGCVTDVLIDMSGFLVGTLILLGILHIFHRKKNKTNSEI